MGSRLLDVPQGNSALVRGLGLLTVQELNGFAEVSWTLSLALAPCLSSYPLSNTVITLPFLPPSLTSSLLTPSLYVSFLFSFLIVLFVGAE